MKNIAIFIPNLKEISAIKLIEKMKKKIILFKIYIYKYKYFNNIFLYKQNKKNKNMKK